MPCIDTLKLYIVHLLSRHGLVDIGYAQSQESKDAKVGEVSLRSLCRVASGVPKCIDNSAGEENKT